MHMGWHSTSLPLQALLRLLTSPLWGVHRYFLVTEKLQPTILFSEDCMPGNLSGLYTPAAGGPASGGYSTRNLSGSFIIISTDFFFRDVVQRFVQLVVATGGHFRYRWNEQAVLAMLWQIFLQPEELVLFDFPFAHKEGSCFDRTVSY